ncbi:prion-like-(Q/N-rich) domain-bearing protein 25 [Mytilus edulis]|uniref:prion-like-(Q/N-rich) domain-bearing protein 25 n=1 Tax=Mytilus edulis TaxID=6550 RepID=UPI0039EF803C
MNITTMAYLCKLVLLILPLISLYFQFAVSAGVPLAGRCTNTTNCTANTANSECKAATCQCKIAFYAQKKTCVAKVNVGSACNTTTPCKDGNATCKGTCKCNDAFYKDSSNACSPRIYPNKPCGTISAKNDSCIDNAYCNKTSSICVCGKGYTTNPTSCNSAVTMAVVEISTLIMCFMLAYLDVLK